MADRTCPRCGKGFGKPFLLRRHLQRKTPCALIVERHELPVAERAKPFPCQFCGHRFTSPSGLCTHIKQSCRVAHSKDGLDTLYKHTLQKQLEEQRAETAAIMEKLAVQTKQLDKLQVAEKRLAGLLASTGLPPRQPETQAAAQQNATVNLNLHGLENLDHLDPPRVAAILHGCAASLPPITGFRLPEGEKHSPEVQKAVGAASREVLRILLTETYANPDRPENLTMYVPNKKEKQVMCYTTGATAGSEPMWRLLTLETITPMVQKKVLDRLNANQPWEAPTREKLHQYGLLVRGAFDYDRPAFGRLIRNVVLANKAVLKSLGVPLAPQQ